MLRPAVQGSRYDLGLDIGGRTLRVQCKWAAFADDIVIVRMRTCYQSPTRGFVRGTYDLSEVDAIAAYCEDLDAVYLLPIDEVAGQGFLHLRLTPPRNNQRAGVKWACDYEFGAIAQLGERLTGSQEAGGSSPPSSTSTAASVTIGSHELRERFGW